MSSYTSHRYPTRFQSKKQHSLQSEYARNVAHMNQLYTRTQTTHDMDRMHAMTEFYVFLQEFQPWRENAQLRAALKQKIIHYLEVELPTEVEYALKWRPKQGKEDALYALEAEMLGLQRLM